MYSTSGEPFFTTSVPESSDKATARRKAKEGTNVDVRDAKDGPPKDPAIREVSCLDYLFCSSSSIRVCSVLTMVTIHVYDK